MSASELLALFKLQIQILTDAFDTYLLTILEAAQDMMEREGIVVDTSSPECVQVILMQASYLYDKRKTGEAEPRRLRYAKNNLLFSQKIRQGLSAEDGCDEA